MNPLPPHEPSYPAKSSALLEARDLSVGSSGTEVLRDLSFTLQRGRILGLIGESGAGKSMVGRIIANQLPPGFAVTTGSLHFQGDDLLSLARSTHRKLLGRRIAFVPQEPMGALNPSMTIGRHFTEHLARLDVPKRERRAATLETLADMRLPAPEIVYDKYPFQLSGGMCQRVLIGLAFVSKPDLVIADEPTASLDVTTQIHIVGLLRGLQDKHGTGVLFITHQLRLASHLCDDVAVLYAGEIVEYGSSGTVFRRPQHPYTRALDTASPRFSGPWHRLASPPGTMPGLNEFRTLSGCRFTPRCASAISGCTMGPPALRILKEQIAVRCIRDDAMPAEEPEVVSQPPALTEKTAPLLAVDNVFKSFRSGGLLLRRAESPAVNGISFSIAAGEFVGIVGETGSGKSTLGRMIMGIEKPTAGRILLDGKPIGHSPAEWSRRIRSIQLVFQDPRSALNPRRTVRSLVTQPMQAAPHPNRDVGERAMQLLRDTGLPQDVAACLPQQISGGQRQRVNIARGLCVMPRLLIADEIASGLDVSVQAQILNLLLRLKREYQIALLMISHDLAIVRYVCSRVIVMWRGEIVESGSVDQVFAGPQHAYTRELIAAMPPDDLDSAWAPLAAANGAQATAGEARSSLS